MTKKEINTVATIAERYSKLENMARLADSALNDLLFAKFDDSLTKTEVQQLNKSRELLQDLAQKYTGRKAIKYAEALLDGQGK